MRQKCQLMLFSLCTVALLLAFVGLLTPANKALAQGGDWEIVAQGLDSPRHLFTAPDGTIYIAEAGHGSVPGGATASADLNTRARGFELGSSLDTAEWDLESARRVGDNCVAPVPEDPNFLLCIGQTGAVTRIAPDGSVDRLVDDLYSLGVYSMTAEGPEFYEAIGPQGVAMGEDGNLYVTVGFGLELLPVREILPEGQENLGQLVRVMPDGSWTNVADIGTYEAINDPDNDIIDTNPFGLRAVDDGFLVADAGGDAVLKVTLGDTEPTITTVAVFTDRLVEYPPGSGNAWAMDIVPTSLGENAAGEHFVGQLTGFPFPLDGANIWRIGENIEPTVALEDFTTIMGVHFDEADNLYVLEMWTNGAPTSEDLSGLTSAVIRVASDGSRTPIMNATCGPVPATPGLCFSTGMTLHDDMIYAVHFGILSTVGGGPGGMLVRFPVEAAPTAITLGDMSATGSPALPVAALALLTFSASAGLLLALRRTRRHHQLSRTCEVLANWLARTDLQINTLARAAQAWPRSEVVELGRLDPDHPEASSPNRSVLEEDVVLLYGVK